MTFIQMIAIVSIFYTIGNAITEIKLDTGSRAFKQIVIVIMYVFLVLLAIMMGEKGYWLVIGASCATVSLLRRQANVPVYFDGKLQAKEREHR